MIEVPEKKLVKYLNGLRDEGYSLVGLEQTISSKMLGKVEFPKKMALVLGKETEGIPPEILQVECSSAFKV